MYFTSIRMASLPLGGDGGGPEGVGGGFSGLSEANLWIA